MQRLNGCCIAPVYQTLVIIRLSVLYKRNASETFVTLYPDMIGIISKDQSGADRF